MASAQRGGKRRTGRRRRTPKRPLTGGDLLAVIDELDRLDATLGTLPTLTTLARLAADGEEWDDIARLGLLRGVDVDKDTPREDSMLIDAAATPDTIVAAVRWRLQRVAAVLRSTHPGRTPA